MCQRSSWAWLANSLSLFRLSAGLVFASLAFQNVSLLVIATLYSLAATSDLVDGLVARRFQSSSYLGRIVDLVSDKSLTIISMLYAAARDIDVRPLALIAVREVVMLGARLIVVDGRQLLPTSRMFGGLLAFLLWGNTLLLILTPLDHDPARIVPIAYWGCAVVMVINLLVRLVRSRKRLKVALANR